MSFDIRFIGNSNFANQGNVSLEMRPGKTYDEILDVADLGAVYGKFSFQGMSTWPVQIDIKYSNWYHPTLANKEEEIWFDLSSLSVPANTPIIQDIEIPFCKFLKLTMTPTCKEYVEYATLCLVSA